jgi:hypothetical protein
MTLILSGTSGLSDVDGSAATPAIRGTDANTGIFFPAADTIAFSEGGAEAMRIDSSGNVGIGTSSPTGKLDVAGSVGTFRVETNGDAIAFTKNGTNFISAKGGSSASLIFETGGATERARIDSSGNLLVGTTSAVLANSFVQIQYSSTSQYGMAIKNTSSTYNGSFINFLNSSGNSAGYIVQNGTTTVSYSTSSDYRLKNTIAPMTGALAKVALLKPVTYKWNFDGSDGQGFIAHELAEIVPDCVTGAKDAVDAEGNPKYQGIDTSFLVATLTAAIKEQQALITTLTDRITALEAKP